MSDVAGVEGLAYEPVNPANSTTCAEGAADKDRIEAKGVSGASAAPWPEWQPIETAPRDGTRIWAYSPEASEPQTFPVHWLQSTDPGDSGDWYDADHHDSGGPIDVELTAWLPLPPPPGEKT